ncbi:MAG: IS1634 family transposase [Thermodesulfobacteriota bacterium]|nr:IS1634 family transposase [Thermodesulfobacteriota bacterium]
MFVRAKKSGKYRHLQVVHNRRVEGKVRQQVIGTLGRVDVLEKTGQLDGLIPSCGRYAREVAVLDAQRGGKMPPGESVRIGPSMVFERLWRESGMPKVIGELLASRTYEFDVERAVFLTVLHRLFDPGSDRGAEVWRERYRMEGTERLRLHHLYRTMAWLGEPLEEGKAQSAELSPRCTKDVMEEWLFEERRDLLSTLNIVFFDTTSIYFEGEGEETLGEYGHSKDHRPDRKQMMVGVVLEESGRPLCCELWPGNTTPGKALLPVVERLKKRFPMGSVCVVADRGTISRNGMEELQHTHQGTRFILGARMRAVKEVREEVLSRPGRYQVVHGPRKNSHGEPAPLKVKEVRGGERRYIVCHNQEQAEKDRADREAIVAALRERLKRGDKSLVGNRGYRKYLKTTVGRRFGIDEEKVQSESRFDGKWVLQTDTELSAPEVALKYKELWMVEAAFRSVKCVLNTRPVYPRLDETIRGHVFCSFLALMLLKDLHTRMEGRGWRLHWDRLRHDLNALEEITIRAGGKTFVIRTRTLGDAGRAIQAVGVALGPTLRLLSDKDSG